MADATFFQKTWIIHTPSTSRAYPDGCLVKIDTDPLRSGRFAISWTDGDLVPHTLGDLLLNRTGKLTGPGVEEGTDRHWEVTIKQVGADTKIEAEVSGPLKTKKRGFAEASLAGTWGAEAPPPFDDPKGPGTADR